MGLKVTCFYCGAQKEIEPGNVVKLACDECSSPRVVLEYPAVFRCVLCRRIFELPAKTQVKAYHSDEECKGRSLILLDYD